MRPLTPWRIFFLCMALAGLALPWYFNLAYFEAGGSVAPSVFWRDAFANALTTSITLDVYLSAVVFSVAVARDRALGAWRWVCIAACFGLGLAFAMPLYLAYRARSGGAESSA